MSRMLWFWELVFSSLNQEQVHVIRSSQKKVFIRFHTNESNYGLGFLMTYTAVPQAGARKLLTGPVWICCAWLWHHSFIVAYPCLSSALPPSDGCDGGLKVISGAFGVLASPQYSKYPHNLNCFYAIDISGKLKTETALARCFCLVIECVFDRVW